MFKENSNYVDYIGRLYHLDVPEIVENNKKQLPMSSITFQITNDCCCKCTYCYQGNKKKEFMTEGTIKKCIDMIFNMYDDEDCGFFDKRVNLGVILEFIGGEPLMNTKIMDYGCTYFLDRCIEMHHPWALNWQVNLISNGRYYFTEDFQNFLKKFNEFCYFNVSIDGPQEMHDKCRVYHDGSGNFDDAWKAIHHYRENYNNHPSTKVTISPDNVDQVDKVVKFFIEDGVYTINANVVYEAHWNYEQAAIYYQKLKAIADYLLTTDVDFYFSTFSPWFYEKMVDGNDQNWCGGDGRMIAFDPNGIVYPCIRYMETSLNGERDPIIIGNCDEGIYKTEETKKIQQMLKKITRRTQSTDKCYDCPVGAGCSWCSAWNYQEYGTIDCRNTNICYMHEAASLASCYYWNKYYRQTNSDDRKIVNLPEEEALKIISKEEYNMLIDLQKVEE